MSEPTQNNRKKSRRRNGDGNTYRHKNGWRTAMARRKSRYKFAVRVINLNYFPFVVIPSGHP